VSTAPQLWLYITLKDAISGVKKKSDPFSPLHSPDFFGYPVFRLLCSMPKLACPELLQELKLSEPLDKNPLAQVSRLWDFGTVPFTIEGYDNRMATMQIFP